MTDYSAYAQIVQVIVPFVVGFAAKWGHGIIITKVHQFRAAIDDIDNALQSGTANPQQQTQVISDVKALVSKAQTL